MDQCKLIYIFIACLVIAMLIDVSLFIYNKKSELRKVKDIAKSYRRR